MRNQKTISANLTVERQFSLVRFAKKYPTIIIVIIIIVLSIHTCRISIVVGLLGFWNSYSDLQLGDKDIGS